MLGPTGTFHLRPIDCRGHHYSRLLVTGAHGLVPTSPLNGSAYGSPVDDGTFRRVNVTDHAHRRVCIGAPDQRPVPRLMLVTSVRMVPWDSRN